jgi:hypothetical protein
VERGAMRARVWSLSIQEEKENEKENEKEEVII